MTVRRATSMLRPFTIAAVGAVVAYPYAADRGFQQPTFTTAVETVRVDASVRQGGQAVRGLSAADFDIFDNGVRQTVDFVAHEKAPVHVVLALDVSGSVRGARLGQLRDAGARLVDILAPGEAAAVVAFTELVSIRSGFTAEKPRLISAMQEGADGADTALFDATHAALVLGASQAGRSLVIVFSDGADTASFLSSDLVLNTARRTGPVVYAVTSIKEDQGDFLGDLVRLTGGRRLEVASLDRLSGAFEEVLSESRDRYLLSYTPTGVDPGGWHEISVRVRGRRAEVRARPGYLASP
jgi:VWFA-related protein